MRIGLFGGAFNPVHNGHINLARCYIDSLNLDKLLFIPTATPPHRASDDLASEVDRINMLEIATKGIDKAAVSDVEFKLEGKSYTYNTVRYLKTIYPNDEFYLIVGADQFLNFKSWYRYDELLDMVTLCTAAREMEQYAELEHFAKCDDAIKNAKYHILNIPVYVVSSSQIRGLIKNNQGISDCVCAGVEKYIKDNDLYV